MDGSMDSASLGPDRRIIGIAQANVCDVRRNVTMGSQQPPQRWG